MGDRFLLTAILAYLISGVAAIAPALTLGIYFTHFAGLSAGEPLLPIYSQMFSSPLSLGGGANIGYMGYLIMAVLLGYLIKYLFIGWDMLKETLAPKVDSLIKSLAKKIKPLSGLCGMEALEMLDLIVMILIVPVLAMIAVFLAVRYGIELPFNAMARELRPVLVSAFDKGNALGGLLLGAMTGFDIVGPLSRTAFEVAANFAAGGNAVPMTAFSITFAAMGWVSFFCWIFNKLLKKGGTMDTDDSNLAMSGPINAFFDNMKLTVAFAMPFAYRDPLRTIPCYIFTGALTGLFSGIFSLANRLYVTAERILLFERGDLYLSFLQPMRSIRYTSHGALIPVIVAVTSILGGFILLLLKDKAEKRRRARGEAFKPCGDVTIELRRYAKELSKNFLRKT